MMTRILFTSCIIAGVLVFTSVVNAQNIKGTPGIDYPNYDSLPKTSFKCSEQKYIPGFYADLETNCQAFYFCFKDQQEGFLCPTGTTFNQEKLACDSWFTSNCSLAPLFYNVNDGPAMRSAGKKLPMLLKLRNRSPDKAQTTTNVYETLSSLYDGSTDNKLHKGVETSHFSSNENETSISNNTNGYIPEESSSLTKAEPESESVQLLSEDTQQILEENFQSDSNEDYTKIELGGQEDLVYDSVTDGYYVYDKEEWQPDPESEEFSHFYDNMNVYEVPFEDYSDNWNEDEGTISESSDSLNIDEDTDDEFSRRRLDGHEFTSYRRRPTYVVLEDEESEFPIKVLDNESGLREDVTVETSEAVSELPFEREASEVEETEEGNQELTEELRMKFPYYPEYVSENTLSSEEFVDAVTEFAYEKGYQFNENETESLEEHTLQSEQVEEFVADETDFEDASAYINDGEESSYESDSIDFDLQDNSDKGRESDLYLNVDQGDYETKIEESDDEAGSVDDTYVILPDELDEAEYENRRNEYTLEDMDSNVQMDEHQQNEVVDEFEQYGLYQDRPDFPVFVDSEQLQRRPFSDSIYYRQMYNTDAYTYHTPSVDGEISQQFRPQIPFSPPVYDTENGLVYGNFYDDYSGEILGEYESEESRQHYPSMDAPWYQNLDDVELENQLGVTDEPLIAYSTQSDIQNSEEALITTMSSEQVDAYSNEFDEDPAKLEETYYVLDLDEDEQVDDANMKDSGNGTSFYDVRSEEFDATENLKKLPLESVEPSVSAGISLDESAESSEQVEDFQSNVLGSLDSFLTSESGSKVPDSKKDTTLDSKSWSNSWPSQVTESSAIDDSTVTLSSALERLASLQNTKSTQPPSFTNLDFSGDTRFMNNMAFPESMDFGPYGYGGNMGQQYSMLDSMAAGQQMEAFSHRTGETEKPNLSKLSSIQERLRSMKQGKFGAFKKYMNTMKN